MLAFLVASFKQKLVNLLEGKYTFTVDSLLTAFTTAMWCYAQIAFNQGSVSWGLFSSLVRSRDQVHPYLSGVGCPYEAPNLCQSLLHLFLPK